MEGTKNPVVNKSMVECYCELGIYTSAPETKQIVTSDLCLYDLDHDNGYGINFARDFNDSLCIFDEPCGVSGETWYNRTDNSTYIDKGNGNAFRINASGDVSLLVYTDKSIGHSSEYFLTYLGRMGENSGTTFHAGALVSLNIRMENLENSTKKEGLEGNIRDIEVDLMKARTMAENVSNASQQAYYELTEKIDQNLRPKIESSILDVRISKDKKRRRKPNFKY